MLVQTAIRYMHVGFDVGMRCQYAEFSPTFLFVFFLGVEVVDICWTHSFSFSFFSFFYFPFFFLV